MATSTWLSWVLLFISLGVSIHLWFVVRRLKGEVYIDALTGVLNRRAFDKAFEREVARAHRGSGPLSMLFIDVDHFGSVNRDFGHPAGDMLLRHIAEEISYVLPRRTDSLFRYGGEEFVVLLPGTPKFGARKKAEEVLWAVRQGGGIDVTIDGSSSNVRRTVSIGVTIIIERESPEFFLERANRAMHEAKKGGRDTLVEL